MKKFLILSFLPLLFSCEKSEDQENYFNLQTSVGFYVVNEKGEDLLNPANPEHYREEEIKLFYLKDGNVEEVFNPDLTHPRNLNLQKRPIDEYFRLGVGLNHFEKDKINTTYLQWSEKDVDTITAEYDFGQNYTVVRKIWFNEKLIYNWEDDREVEPLYKIIK